LRLRAAGVRPAALQRQGSERPAQQAQQRLAGFPITRCAEDMNPAEQQQAFIVRQFLAIRSPQQDGAQFRRGFLDSQCAHSDSEVRQLPFRRDGMKVVFDRSQFRRVLAIAFEFFLFHSALPCVLQVRC
jgi:hypothetical protein